MLSPITATPNGSPIPLSGPTIDLTDLNSMLVVSAFQHEAENSDTAHTNNARKGNSIEFRKFKVIKGMT